MEYESVYVKPFALNTRICYLCLKRLMDIILSLIAILIAFPVMIIISILIKLDSKGPIIYKQKRLGKFGNLFTIYKFRTMVYDAEEAMKNFTDEQKEEFNKFFKLKNDPRITRVGKFLRKTSLDELPQIFNILIGNMSFIGPRPVVENEITKYGNLKGKYLSVKPGLTGWWACNGRSLTTYQERIELEIFYINNISFKLDFKCFIKTVISIITKEGAI